MSINSDSVMRSVYYKYLHPKEVFIAEGVLVPDLARKKVRMPIKQQHLLFIILISFLLFTILIQSIPRMASK